MQAIKDEGYRAHAQGKTMADNPYASTQAEHWHWRMGFVEAVIDTQQPSFS